MRKWKMTHLGEERILIDYEDVKKAIRKQTYHVCNGEVNVVSVNDLLEELEAGEE